MDLAADSGCTGTAWRCRQHFRHSGNGNTQKNELKPWQKKEWCIPKPGAEFVARMEDVLDVYQRPYDPLRPVVCLDETNRPLVEKRSIPPKARKIQSGRITNIAAAAWPTCSLHLNRWPAREW